MNDDTNRLIQAGSLDMPQFTESRQRVYMATGISPALHGVGYGGGTEPKIIVVGKLDIKGKDQIKRVYGTDGIAPTLSTMQGGGQEPRIVVHTDKKESGTCYSSTPSRVK